MTNKRVHSKATVSLEAHIFVVIVTAAATIIGGITWLSCWLSATISGDQIIPAWQAVGGFATVGFSFALLCHLWAVIRRR